MKILANIEKEEVLEIEKIFGRLNSLHNRKRQILRLG